jgi:hypothetical protein
MPHHTANGWNHRISQTLRDDIEQIRKRVLIAWRKEQDQKPQQSNVGAGPASAGAGPSNIGAIPPAKRRKLSADALPPATAARDDIEQDLSAIAHFFANGGAEGEEDHWQILTAKVMNGLFVVARCPYSSIQTPCKTEKSWEEFYGKHYTQVSELYALLTDEPQSAVE